MSNAFPRITYDPIAVPTTGHVDARVFVRGLNEKLGLMRTQINAALGRLKIDLRDIGYEITFSVPKYSTENPPWGTDIPVPHGMGIVPRRYIVWDVRPAKKAGPLPTAITDGDLWRGFNQWDTKNVFFQISQNAWFAECTFSVLLFA